MKVRSPKDITQLRVGQRLELECQTDKNSGAFWIHQDKSGTLHFIVFISSVSWTTFSRDQRTSPRFEASKHNSIYLLVVKSFTPQDEGNYFCMMNFNQMLFFSPGQPAFLPGQQHLHPTSLSPDKMPSTSCPCPFSQLSLPQTPFPSLLAQGIL
ncbi:PREDICTED: T-cell surface glycoprotein CD8 alpha chain-like [Corvus brachyrhynchos]|uniref:T-cell surface glycoprotein CD8 alpha chain-like n=1 Tax=Corvus brachyrhynchos TaxID=85066 RepID=UPI0008166261|nr:PREDICTED: T-cell surface glycoprotein CD8 alpha chain-like [Corvus brachyrhynchos]